MKQQLTQLHGHNRTIWLVVFVRIPGRSWRCGLVVDTLLQRERIKSWSRTNTAERGENGADIELALIQRKLGELIEEDCWNLNMVSWRCGIAAQYLRTRAERYPPRVCSLHCNIIPEYTAVEVTLLRFGDNLTRSLSGVTILQQDCNFLSWVRSSPSLSEEQTRI